ncbi:hypothetical protein [Marinomonas posidonica]|uniref:Lipoprotein n=1 Tax=Marinomonas posidonica (strain CECT 7376 / NCIMB 14433 / IVIA-Po-181) TaxID=491952 RepID=F6D079_MARPP|nr:hypothetical protein [Marinomonas posidonica]AEF55903.1 hypothetical protein Mar181_2874 [Marinomonas posidonica IVIA-Po-181]
MKLMKSALLVSLLLGLTACVSKIAVPQDMPKASFTVTVTGFIKDNDLTNYEYVRIDMKNADESWQGYQIIKPDQTRYELDIPAEQALTATVNLMQGGGKIELFGKGGSFSASCGLIVPLQVSPGDKVDFVFNLQHESNEDKIAGAAIISGCDSQLMINDKAPQKLVGEATFSEIT